MHAAGGGETSLGRESRPPLPQGGATLDRLPQKVVHRWLSFGANKNLIGKQTPAQANQGSIDPKKKAPNQIVPQRSRKRRGDAPHFYDYL